MIEHHKNQLMLRHINLLQGVKEVNQCEDILQEVFLTLLVKTPKFKNQQHEKHWLIRVAINKSKDYNRSFWKRMVEITEKDISSNNANKKI